MSRQECESRETSRRAILQSGAGVLTTVLAGCLGGGGSGNNSTNGSANGTGTETGSRATTHTTDQSSTSAVGTGTNTTTTTAIPSVLGTQPEFSEGELSISLNTDVELDEVQLMDPHGEMFGSYEPHQYEGAATFTLIQQTSEQLGYKSYPYGTYEAVAVQGDSAIDRQAYDLQPEFSITNIESRRGSIGVEIENIGSAPAPITAARIYRPTTNPGPNEFGGGFVDQNAIVPPGESTTIETRLMGFGEVYSVGNNSSVSDYENEYCTGETRPVTVSYRVFDEVNEITGSLVFGGRPIEGPQGNATCSEYTINTGANVTISGTNATGNMSGNLTHGNRSNVSNATNRSTSGNLTVGNNSSATTDANTSAKQSNSSDD